MIKLEKAATKIMAAIGTAVMLFLLFYSWKYTKRIFSSDFFQDEKDSILWNLVCSAVVLAVAGASALYLRKVSEKTIHIATVLCAVITALFCLKIARDAGTYCVADQYQSFAAAEAFFTGDTEWLQTSEYHKMYPFQLGLSWIYFLFFRIAGRADNSVIQSAQALCVGVMLYAGFHIVRRLTHSRAAEVFYLLMAMLFAPMYCYVLFIYGETIGTCSAMCAVWFWLEANRTDRTAGSKWGYWGAAIAMLAVMYVARSGLLVVWIAMLIMQLLLSMKWKKWNGIVLVCAALALMIFTSYLLRVAAEKTVGTKYDSGAPYVLWVAMGMQETDPGRGPGAYNGYNVVTYEETEGNSAEATTIAEEYIAGRWQEWMQNPAQMYRFIREKMLCQWIEPTYGGFKETGYLEDPRPWIDQCYNGEWNARLLVFLNRYQAVVYLFVLGYFLMILAGKLEGEQILPGIILLGGFFFTMIWEAKSRYVYPYIVMILPCAACSITYYGGLMAEQLKKMGRAIKGRKQKQKEIGKTA